MNSVQVQSSLEQSHRYSGGPCNLGAGLGRVWVTRRARAGKVDNEIKKCWVTLHAVQKLSDNYQIAMYEGARNAVPMTQRMRTSKNDAAQANKSMIRQTLEYVTSRVRAASTVKAEETQPKANRMRYRGSVGRNNTGQSHEDVIALSKAMITQTALFWTQWVRRTVRGAPTACRIRRSRGRESAWVGTTQDTDQTHLLLAQRDNEPPTNSSDLAISTQLMVTFWSAKRNGVTLVERDTHLTATPSAMSLESSGAP